jgi:acetyl esterase/lipase
VVCSVVILFLPHKRFLILVFTLLSMQVFSSVTTLAQASVPEYPNVEYARVDTFRLLLDVYLPDIGIPPYPVVVWIHGGGWRSGSKESVQGVFLTLSGYALVSINYRLSQESLFPAQIHDCKAAIRWVRAHAPTYGFDPDRIGVWGSSAGGHLASLVGTTQPQDGLEGTLGDFTSVSSRVQAVCDWFGHSNFTTIFLFPSDIDHASPNGPESRLLGVPVMSNLDLAWQASPIAYVNAGDPSFLIMHGTGDVNVPYHQSVELDSALSEANVPVEFRSYPGEGHGGGVFSTDSIRQRVREFFDRTLHPGVTAVRDRREEQHGQSLGAYPNPWNSTTTIQYHMETGGRASLRLYDVLGREIRTIVDADEDAGQHVERLDGSELASGIYILRLISPDKSREQLRVTLIR